MLASLQFQSPLTAAVVGIFAMTLFAITLLTGFGWLHRRARPLAPVARRWGLIGLRSAAIATMLLLLLNPTHVTQSPHLIEIPEIYYLLDSSQSMAAGDQVSRFDHALRLMGEADLATRNQVHAQVKLFQFGRQLSAVEDAAELGLTSRAGEGIAQASNQESAVAGVCQAGHQPLAPTDVDTQLFTALRDVSSRFGQRPPAGIVLFSDGRTRDEANVVQLMSQFVKLNVPVHVVPIGGTAKGGDVAIVACVVPSRARRFAEVEVQVFLRSYGFAGQRCEVSLTAPGEVGTKVESTLAPPMPITLQDGFQTVPLTFRSVAKTDKLKAAVTVLPNEVSIKNNSFLTAIQIDHTKIRVLYAEGNSRPAQPAAPGGPPGLHGPYSDLQHALAADQDIECVVLQTHNGQPQLSRVSETGGTDSYRGFPDTLAELSAFDAVILSDVSRDSFTAENLVWLEKWIGERGGGLIMVGGQRSFSAGHWNNTLVAKMLPIEMLMGSDWQPGTNLNIVAESQMMSHPLWAIVTDEQLNRDIVGKFPSCLAANRWAGVKPDISQVLATSKIFDIAVPAVNTNSPAVTDVPRPIAQNSEPLKTAAESQPAIVAGRYGRGRTMAMAMPITAPWATEFLTKWAGNDARYYGKFWRNAVYWLTESSGIGRRRLIVNADKKFYRPGEMISLTASAFDETASQTGSYKINCTIEPKTSLSNLKSNDSPIYWPTGKARDMGQTGPLIAWGEVINISRTDATISKPVYSLKLPLTEAITESQSLRLELTAMEDFTQVDSTSLDIQILHDPFEQQNPSPNYDLLKSIAKHSGGTVIDDSAQLAQVLRDVNVATGTPVVKPSPLRNTWWVWTLLVGLLVADWLWRRVVGRT